MEEKKGERSQSAVEETRRSERRGKVENVPKVKGGSAERFRKLPRAELQ